MKRQDEKAWSYQLELPLGGYSFFSSSSYLLLLPSTSTSTSTSNFTFTFTFTSIFASHLHLLSLLLSHLFLIPPSFMHTLTYLTEHNSVELFEDKKGTDKKIRQCSCTLVAVLSLIPFLFLSARLLFYKESIYYQEMQIFLFRRFGLGFGVEEAVLLAQRRSSRLYQHSSQRSR